MPVFSLPGLSMTAHMQRIADVVVSAGVGERGAHAHDPLRSRQGLVCGGKRLSAARSGAVWRPAFVPTTQPRETDCRLTCERAASTFILCAPSQCDSDAEQKG
jgi:hypothetical protein